MMKFTELQCVLRLDYWWEKVKQDRRRVSHRCKLLLT